MGFLILIFASLFLATTRPTTAGIIMNSGMIINDNKMTIACKGRDQIIRQTLSSEGVLTQLVTENTISDIAPNGSIAVLNNTISGTTRVVEVVEAEGASKEINLTRHLNGTSQLTIHGWSKISVTEKLGCRKTNYGTGSSINMGIYPGEMSIFGNFFNGKYRVIYDRGTEREKLFCNPRLFYV